MAEKKEKKAKNIHEVKVEITGKDWEKKLDETFKKIIKKVKIDGFRPGKAPRNIYEQKYGKQSIVVEAVDSCMNEAYVKALKEFKGEPIMQPTVGIEKADETGKIRRHDQKRKNENRMGAGKHRKMHERD